MGTYLYKHLMSSFLCCCISNRFLDTITYERRQKQDKLSEKAIEQANKLQQGQQKAALQAALDAKENGRLKSVPNTLTIAKSAPGSLVTTPVGIKEGMCTGIM